MEEGKKKTIIWDSDSEPPKNYIWAKDDDGFLEFKDGTWEASETVAPASGGSGFEDGWTLKQLTTEDGDVATYDIELSSGMICLIEELPANGIIYLSENIIVKRDTSTGSTLYFFGNVAQDIGCFLNELEENMTLHFREILN